MLCFRIPRRFLTQILTNKERIFHLVCACVFLYMIRDLKNFQNCNHDNNTPSQTKPVFHQNPSKIKTKKESSAELKDTEIKIKKKELGNLSKTLLLIYT